MKSHIVRFCISIPITAYSCALSGVAISTLWGWFVAGKFGLPALSTLEAIGVYLIFSYMAYQSPRGSDMDEDPNKMLVSAAIMGAIRPVFAIALGAIVKSLM
jgi:hypothetical protein